MNRDTVKNVADIFWGTTVDDELACKVMSAHYTMAMLDVVGVENQEETFTDHLCALCRLIETEFGIDMIDVLNEVINYLIRKRKEELK